MGRVIGDIEEKYITEIEACNAYISTLEAELAKMRPTWEAVESVATSSWAGSASR